MKLTRVCIATLAAIAITSLAPLSAQDAAPVPPAKTIKKSPLETPVETAPATPAATGTPKPETPKPKSLPPVVMPLQPAPPLPAGAGQRPPASTGVAISDNVLALPDASAILDINLYGSAKKGMLVPRMTQAERNLIAAPATGLLIYQTDTSPGFYYFTGASWTQLTTGGGMGFALPFNDSAASTVPSLLIRNTQPNNDSPAIQGIHDVTDYFGIGVSGVGGWKGVTGRVNATGDDVYIGVEGTAGSTNSAATVYGVYGITVTNAGAGVIGATLGTTGYGGLFTSPAGGRALRAGSGNVQFDNLGGTGTRMVVADNTGILSTQAIPTGLALPFSGSDATSTSFLVSNTGTGRAIEGRGNGGNHYGVLGSNSSGIFAFSNTSSPSFQANHFGSGFAVQATNFGTGDAGYFEINSASNSGNALFARTNASGAALRGYSDGSGLAGQFSVQSSSNSSRTLYSSTIGTGNAGYFEISNASSSANALEATTNGGGFGILGSGLGGGVRGRTSSSAFNASGVLGEATSTSGIVNGVFGISSSTSGTGVSGFASATSGATTGGYFLSNSPVGTGIFASGGSFAGRFSGNVQVTGTLSKGGGSFKIDHPLEPANKYLYHSFVESPDMMNIYNGLITLNAQGEAAVEMPKWFEALNKEFRYQLTAVGAPAPNLYVAEEMTGNRFKIAGGKPNMKVSWQITGIRKDAFAEKHRIPVEEEKTGDERGKYLHPAEHGAPESMGVGYEMQQRGARRNDAMNTMATPAPPPAVAPLPVPPAPRPALQPNK